MELTGVLRVNRVVGATSKTWTWRVAGDDSGPADESDRQLSSVRQVMHFSLLIESYIIEEAHKKSSYNIFPSSTTESQSILNSRKSLVAAGV